MHNYIYVTYHTTINKEDEVLFTLPRHLLLSSQTSRLRQQKDMAQVLDAMSGWNPLILCLMYESQLTDSFWKPYFDVLPKGFSTPMFWNKEDLESLQGTDIVEKVGKEEAEAMFVQELQPIIKDHPEAFNPDIHNCDLFHQCGSLIMAYSFHDPIGAPEPANGATQEDHDNDDNDEEEEEEGLLAMVPMADMLNHKTGYNNARLFHEPECLRMKAIKSIQTGDQIYNTYGDLCNADLLRKYGFADESNPFDLVELNGGNIVELCCDDTDTSLRERKIEFLMEEEALDDCFVIDTEHVLPPELISALYVLRASAEEFAKMETKQKLPKPKLTPAIAKLGMQILEERMKRYPQEDDDQALLQSGCSPNKRHALLVRIGEKRILEATINKLKREAEGQKRAVDEEDSQGHSKKKKARV
ncbi:hypothetical protein BDB00DRAFT_823797 [Zychaea mexicana]|uniref:uncharacterized protein n=1 Tax=Zychaea mexicana TaxID=64656 RepID=UPI0022FE1891|nr:uncharacterized protein BDB00DRAFT_823797 [Zychaea mexicana]KAI9493377.1 hypothetical protein BDB00DRAFT_823797 [Zychaea mexicana]